MALHTYTALGLCRAGAATLELERPYTLRAGDVFVVPARAPHRMVNREALVWSGLRVEGMSWSGNPIVGIPTDRRVHLAYLFDELAREEQRSVVSTRVVESLRTLVLSEIERARLVDYPDVVARALVFIEANLTASLADVAAAVGRSPAHLTTVVREATGRTVQAHIIARRIDEAKRLLGAGELVEVVAERVGYADATHFGRLFRREVGASPSAWRQCFGADVSIRNVAPKR